MMTLAEVVEKLEYAYGILEADLTEKIATDKRLAESFPPGARWGGHVRQYPEGFTPHQMKDSNGRYILLDALVALAQVKANL